MAQIQFEDDPAAKQLQLEGQQLLHTHDYLGAHAVFAAAIEQLDKQTTDHASRVLQRSSVARDDALSYMLRGLADQIDPRVSHERTHERLMYAAGVADKLHRQDKYDYEPEAWAKLNDERGGTFSLMARLATVNFVAGWNLANHEDPMEHYRDAEKFLQAGSNLHLQASNAINAAVYLRYMYQEGEPAATIPFMVWTQKALGTVALAEENRANSPEEYERARRSVHERIVGVVSFVDARDVIFNRQSTY